MIENIMHFLTPNEWLALVNVVGVLLGVVGLSALLIWVERRLLSVWQDRYGPNRIGPLGLGQVVADMIKIFFKEDWIPPFVEKTLFIIAPMIIMASLLIACAVVPFAPNVGVIDLNIGLLYFLAMTSLGVYSIMLAGWSSNSKYSLLGGLRSSAQMITYEVFMGLSLLGVVMLAGSFNLREIVLDQEGLWNIVRQPLGFLVFFIAGIAETHRAPLDLPEAEQELASGFHTEYSGMKFGMFFVGEYVGIILNSAMVTTLFLGGWMGPFVNDYPILGLFYFVFKVLLLICFFILMRAGLVRPRYDQLMAYGWKVMLPLALLNVLITGAVILGFNLK